MKEYEKQNILIVDDRHENLMILAKLLKGPDRNIVKAMSGKETLSLIHEYDFAIVLLDVQMPEMDGFETAEKMRLTKKGKHIPIIFVTAINKEKRHVFKGYESGAVDYMFKPVDPFLIKSKVEIFCDLHRQKLIIQSQLREIEEKNRILQRQMDEINVLRGFLPICSSCKKIRNDEGYWAEVEEYISDHSEAEFTC